MTDGEDKRGIWIKDGHVNPQAGYHYHAATGKTKDIEQSDAHAPLIGNPQWTIIAITGGIAVLEQLKSTDASKAND